MPIFLPSAPRGILAGSCGSYTITPMSQSISRARMRKISSVCFSGRSGFARTLSDSFSTSSRESCGGGANRAEGVALAMWASLASGLLVFSQTYSRIGKKSRQRRTGDLASSLLRTAALVPLLRIGGSAARGADGGRFLSQQERDPDRHQRRCRRRLRRLFAPLLALSRPVY